MKIEIVATQRYRVLEIYDDEEKLYNYYLEKKGYGDLSYLYGTSTKCPPIEIGDYIKVAEESSIW